MPAAVRPAAVAEAAPAAVRPAAVAEVTQLCVAEATPDAVAEGTQRCGAEPTQGAVTDPAPGGVAERPVEELVSSGLGRDVTGRGESVGPFLNVLRGRCRPLGLGSLRLRGRSRRAGHDDGAGYRHQFVEDTLEELSSVEVAHG